MSNILGRVEIDRMPGPSAIDPARSGYANSVHGVAVCLDDNGISPLSLDSLGRGETLVDVGRSEAEIARVRAILDDHGFGANYLVYGRMIGINHSELLDLDGAL